MILTTLRWLLISFLLLLGGVVHAEGGCPPGMIPASGTDINSCVPIPPGYYSNQQQAQPQLPQPPPQQWEDHWGAIATDGPGGSFGAATNMLSRSTAENAALADCQSKKGSPNCKVELWYTNQCAAMVVGETGHNAKAGATPDEATQTAMNICSAADTQCRVYYSACSLPVQTQ